MKKKYEILKEEKQIGKATVHRIIAVRNFGDVKKGDLGGFIESESNLSHEGKCWVYDDSAVYEFAEVKDNAKIAGNSKVFSLSLVCGNATVVFDSSVCEFALVDGNACISGNCVIQGMSKVFDNAKIYDNVHIDGSTIIHMNADVSKNAVIKGKETAVYDDAVIIGGCMTDSARIHGTAKLVDVNISGYSDISADVEITGPCCFSDFMVLGKIEKDSSFTIKHRK